MADSRLIESWTWYGVATLAFILRYISLAIRLGSWKKWELEDYVMLLAFGFYTNFLVFVTIQEKHPNTNILPPTGTAGMSQAEIEDRIYGAKVTFVLEESMVMTQFLCKLCVCLVYYKLTNGLKNQKLAYFALGYLTAGWFITELFFFGICCRPFMNYFRVFDANPPACTTAQNHLIMSYTFNITSDLIILFVPIPMIVKSKAVLMGVFSFGIFVIIAGTLSRYYTFAQPDSILWIFWYVREASTVVIVANTPHLYAILRQVFHLNAFGALVPNKKSAATCEYGQPKPSGNDGLGRSFGYLGSGKNMVVRSESTEEIIVAEEGRLSSPSWPLQDRDHDRDRDRDRDRGRDYSQSRTDDTLNMH